MTGPSSNPRGEHTPRPGITWLTTVDRTEVLVDGVTTGPDMNEPAPPRPNRATRRALARARKKGN